MKIVESHIIVKRGPLVESKEMKEIEEEMEQAIKAVRWPYGADGFYLDPNSKGKRRGEGNGVKPIKESCINYLKGKGWEDEKRIRKKGVAGTGPLDAVRQTQFGLFAIEWETGNISSSHRALNKICLGAFNGELAGGALILPSNRLYPYLTDRIGNIREILPYLPLWTALPFKEGLIVIYVVEHDGLREGIPRIPKGTDGRALN